MKTIRKYFANITPLNENVIGTKAHGKASLVENGDTLDISIEMFDTPAGIQHWEHFHGFPNGKDAKIATSKQDTNHDGFIDLIETEAVSGTTMVPFDGAPHQMNIPNDNYPVSDNKGYFSYNISVPLEKLKLRFKEEFNTENLELDKRVIYIHGVAKTLELPDTIKGIVGKYDTHVTLPIAVGKIREVHNEI